MNLLNTLLSLLGLKRDTTVDSITKPMAKIVNRLENFAQSQQSAAATDEARASELAALAAKKLESAKQATNLAERYSSLTM